MQVYVNTITGIDDALVSLMMSKRSYTREKELEIREKVRTLKDSDWFRKQMNSLHKYGVAFGHTTLLRYIDISITVEGIHRAAQDDLDAHAKRMDNRIVRASTRLASFSDGEKSDWYKDKILYPFEALQAAGIDVPDKIQVGDITYVKTDFGYINHKDRNTQDVKRGLYPLAIPSNCIFKIQLPELAHIIQFRNKYDGHAHPELWDLCDAIVEQLNASIEGMGDWLYQITTDKPRTLPR